MNDNIENKSYSDISISNTLTSPLFSSISPMSKINSDNILAFSDKYNEKIKRTKDNKRIKKNMKIKKIKNIKNKNGDDYNFNDEPKHKKNAIVPLDLVNINEKMYERNKKSIIKQGDKIYKENDYISKIWDIMSDDTFSSFFDSYLNNYSDIQVSMVFFNLYKTIKEQYLIIFKRDIIREEMVYMLRNIMRDNFMRKYFIQNANDKNIISLDTDIMTNDVIQNFNNSITNRETPPDSGQLFLSQYKNTDT